MPRKRLEKNKIRKIIKIGSNSTYYITLPIDPVRKYGWKEGQKVVVREYRGKPRLVIQDWREKDEK